MKLGNVEFTTAPLRRNPLSSLKKESGLILKKIIAEWLGEGEIGIYPYFP
jgi:hypothetical protein